MQSRTSIKTVVSLAMLVSMFALTACGTPPKREPYAGVDQVGEVDPAQLVGNWKITILNPISGEEDPTVTTEYRGDGTWSSIVIPPEQQNEDLGRMEFAGTGSWEINGDVMFGQATGIEETTGNRFGGLMESVMSLFISKMSGTVNPYEISADRMIFVNEETGQATRLDRI